MPIKPAHVSSGRRLALLIGVNGGPAVPGQKPLLYAVHDAEEMASVLQADYCNFQLFRSPPLLEEQATRDDVRNAILDLVEAAQEDDSILFYFSGHAIPALDNDNVYLVTHGFDYHRLGRTGPFEISFKFLREQLYEHEKADSVVIILDCCYAGMFSDSARDPYLDDLLNKLAKYFETPPGVSPSRQGRERLVLAAAGRTTANERDGHGLMTLCILQALKGEVPQAANADGQITSHLLAEYLATALQPEQQFRLEGSHSRIILATHPELPMRARQAAQRQVEQLRERLSLPDDFLEDRLQGFVGRETEIKEARQKIEELLLQGGYLVITSEAGQGKSSLIAKLVELSAQEQGGFDKVAYHFIPSNPRSGEQVYLLRNLLNLLILKYALPFDLPGESSPRLHEDFQQVLKEIVKRKRQEVIFIDGLDQLVVDRDIGQRDLNFLPQASTKLPGIVFVLGARGDETSSLLRYMKPERLSLDELSRDDFIRLLEHYHVTLPRLKADRLYDRSGGNTLYLSELTRVLSLQSSIADKDVEEILSSIGSDPQNVFSLSIDRLRMRSIVWDKVSKPLLRLLLVAEEALTPSQIMQLFRQAPTGPIDSDLLRQGLDDLGGLVVLGTQQRDIRYDDAQKRYTLKHPLLRKYLQEIFFSPEDQQEQHSSFVVWCSQEHPTLFWTPTHDDAKREQRRYARHYYITHLYHAREWDTLFAVLDAGEYGQAKILEDPSGYSYAQDLLWGQKAAASFLTTTPDVMLSLARLWHYTFLRCSLVSRANSYPEATFRLLLRLGPEQERKASELAEMLTLPTYKAHILALIAEFLADSPERQWEAFRPVSIILQITESLPDDMQKADLLRKLGDTLQRIGHDQEAEQMREKASQISDVADLDDRGDQSTTPNIFPLWLADHIQSAKSFKGQLSKGAVHAGAASDVREETEKSSPERNSQAVDHALDHGKADALLAVSLILRRVDYWHGNEPIWREVEWLIRSLPNTGQKARYIAELALSVDRMGRHIDAEQIRWMVIGVISTFEDEEQRGLALTQFEQTLEQAHYDSAIAEMRKETWKDIESMILDFSDEACKYKAMVRLAGALNQVGELEEASRIVSTLPGEYQKEGVAHLLSETRNEEETGPLRQKSESTIHTLPEDQDSVESLITLAMEQGKTGHEAEARRILLSLENTWKKIQELANLGMLTMQIGQRGQTKQIWHEVEELIHKAAQDEGMGALSSLESLSEQEEGQDQEQPLDRLIAGALELREEGRRPEAEQQFRKIEQIIRRITDEARKNEAWLLLVEARGRTRNLIEVAHLKQEFSPGRNMARFLESYGVLLAQAGRRREAEEMINSILDQSVIVPAPILDTSNTAPAPKDDLIDPIFKSIKDQALVKLAEVYWQSKRWAFAENVIAAIHNEKMRGDILAQQGEIMGWEYALHPVNADPHQIEPDEKSQKYLGDLLKNIKNIIASINDDWKSFQTFIKLGKIMADNRLPREALEFCEDIEEKIHLHENKNAAHFSQEDRKRKIELFSRLGILFEHIGEREKAEDILQEVEEDILFLLRGTHKDQALAKLASALTLAKHWQEAKEVIDAIVNQTIKEIALSDLGHFLALAKRWEEAEKMIGLIENDVTRDQTLFDLINLLTEVGFWTTAREIAFSIKDEALRNEASTNIAAAEQKAQEDNKSEAEQKAQEVEGEASRLLREQTRKRDIRSPVPRGALSALPVPTASRAHQESDPIQSLREQWLTAETVEQALERFESVCELIPYYPGSGIQMWNAFKSVNHFLEALASTDTNVL